MSEHTFTPWFSPDVDPVHIGWYQRLWPNHNDWENDYWDGSRWLYGNPNNRVVGEGMNNRAWRGLLKKSKRPISKPIHIF